MEQLSIFYTLYGWQLALIALVGIIILGVLKYANAFSKVNKDNRKPIYFAISVGFSLVASMIYLAIINQFNPDYIFSVFIAIYALNQAMYSVYETTNLRDLLAKLKGIIKTKIEAKINEKNNTESK